MRQDRYKRYFICVLGCFVLGIGIGICDYAKLGTDPFTVFLSGTYFRIGVTLGMMNMIVNLAQIVIAFLIDRKMISIATFLSMASTSLGIDAVSLFLKSEVTLPLSLAVFLIGELLYALGSAIAILPAAGFDPYNAFLSAIQKLTGKSYHIVRWGVEIVFLVAGWLLGGVVGIGTVLSFLLTGVLVEKFLHFLMRKHAFGICKPE